MKKTIGQKGITLVALIITIVVLLILAVASIMAIYKENIIGYTEEIVTKFEDSKDKEESDIKGNVAILDEYFPKDEPEECKHEKISSEVGYPPDDDEYTYSNLGNGKHYIISVCDECGYRWEGFEGHIYNAEGVCKTCGVTLSTIIDINCGHNSYVRRLLESDSKYHTYGFVCTECAESCTLESEEHSWWYDEYSGRKECYACDREYEGVEDENTIYDGNTIY